MSDPHLKREPKKENPGRGSRWYNSVEVIFYICIMWYPNVNREPYIIDVNFQERGSWKDTKRYIKVIIWRRGIIWSILVDVNKERSQTTLACAFFGHTWSQCKWVKIISGQPWSKKVNEKNVQSTFRGHYLLCQEPFVKIQLVCLCFRTDS